MAHTGQSKRHEDPALAKHGCQGQLIWDAPGTLDTNDLVGEVGVQAHSRTSSCQFDTLVGLGSQKRDLRQADWQVGQGAEKNACHTGDGAGRGNKIEVQNYEQGIIILVPAAVRAVNIANTGSTRVGKDPRLKFGQHKEENDF